MTDDTSAGAGGRISYPFATLPTPGVPEQIAPGVHWLRLPLPVSLAAINVWLLADGAGTALVDTGIYDEQTVALWRTVLEGTLNEAPLTRVIATHLHPDHVGMAGWLTRKAGCRLWMTRLEYLHCRMLESDSARPAPAETLAFYRRAGWDEPTLERFGQRFGGFGRMIAPLPDSYRRIRDGERLHIGEHAWEVVVGAGHSPEHACLYDADRKLLISGDQVLPRISSNVSVQPTEPDADPMSDWLASLAMLRRSVPDDVLVLPSHNKPFRGLHARIEQLQADALDALDRLRHGLKQPKRVVDLFDLLFSAAVRSDDTTRFTLATGEALAGLNHLIVRGEVSVDLDEQGVAWYRRQPHAD
ncbi:MBL fold metallo-hydrolase [Pseudomonas sp. JQ170]|uniref:MBL fold metallo-hydrolase n=1 Tax=unclassified Pseudomonas TaxID=196821 RepID=UPI00264D5361|nr:MULTISPECIES: MBL fold metallo-hydrolase [unclassified Pseudomonas]MDN7139738.1 MBL fold metallo-hydrolase [Pseudomonas sp. JQ170]WRO73808.1 MBL fold metallo-hydrolase [Pseudomonas sp. 170C]